nr:uncharacterized protein LOC113804647 [Penaeus vannamei]
MRDARKRKQCLTAQPPVTMATRVDHGLEVSLGVALKNLGKGGFAAALSRQVFKSASKQVTLRDPDAEVRWKVLPEQKQSPSPSHREERSPQVRHQRLHLLLSKCVQPFERSRQLERSEDSEGGGSNPI